MKPEINTLSRCGVAMVFAIILLAGVLCGGWAYGLQLTGNIHEVEPGMVYRSAQLSAAELSSFVKDKHIKTVLNLRGENPGSEWYDAEMNAVRQSGAQ